MDLLILFMGLGLILSMGNIYLLNKKVNLITKKVQEKRSDLAYFKKAYTKYYDKYIKLTQPDVIH